MAIRQYIGARYVPRFMGTYDPTQIYEALDVVDNGSGTSYIARKTVPAGTPLTDTSFWFVYGASSGAIIALQNDMIQAQNDILSLQGDVAIITPAVNKMKRNIIIIGNSYVDRGCAAQVEKYFETTRHYTGGGAGFLAYTGNTTTFETLLDSAIADSTLDPDSVTDILFVSAMGDCRAYTENPTSFITNLNSVLASIQSKIESNFINCRSVKVAFAETRDQAYFGNNTYNALFRVHATFQSICGQYGINYIGWAGFNSLFINDNLDTDHYHPSVKGTRVIGEWIEAAYFGRAEYTTKYSAATGVFNYGNAGTATVICEFTPDLVHLFVRRATLTQGSACNEQGGDPLLTTFDAAIPIPPPLQDVDMYAPLVRSDTGVQADMLSLSITKDANGRGYIKYNAAPNAATVLSTYLIMPTFCNISYIP